MSKSILSLGTFKSRNDHKDFIKSCYPFLDAFKSLGTDFDKRYVKHDPTQELGEGMRVGVLVNSVDASSKKQLEKLLLDNKLPYKLELIDGWEEATDVLTYPAWGKVNFLVNEVFSEYRYSEDTAIAIYLFRLEQSVDKQDLNEFYRALSALLSKLTLPEEKLNHFKEKLYLYNIYFFELQA